MSGWRSALIPFCGFTEDVACHKNSSCLPGVKLPLCSSFLPTLLDGQMCYKLAPNRTSRKGKKNGLKILLDYNEDLSVQIPMEKAKNSMPIKEMFTFDDRVKSEQGRSAKIHIGTLSAYEGFGGGFYPMTALKKMTSKKDFLSMDLKDKNCVIELYDDCKARKLLQECGCVPWEMPGFEVRFRQKDEI